MRFGLTAEELKFILDKVVHPLKKLGARVFVYGSRARGDFKKFSDLDLMVESSQKHDVSGISEIIQKSNFPYKVDLVEFREFAETYKKSYQEDKIELV